MDVAAAPAPADLGALPVWDLEDLYPGRDSPALQADLEDGGRGRQGLPPAFPGQARGRSTARRSARRSPSYERIQEVLGRIMSYAQLTYAGNVTDPEIGRFYQTMQERVNDDLHPAAVLHARDQPARRRRRWTRSCRRRRWPATGPGCATCAPSGRTSSPTRWSSCCTRRTWPGAAPGPGCSTRRSRDCASRSTARS